MARGTARIIAKGTAGNISKGMTQFMAKSTVNDQGFVLIR